MAVKEKGNHKGHKVRKKENTKIDESQRISCFLLLKRNHHKSKKNRAIKSTQKCTPQEKHFRGNGHFCSSSSFADAFSCKSPKKAAPKPSNESHSPPQLQQHRPSWKSRVREGEKERVKPIRNSSQYNPPDYCLFSKQYPQSFGTQDQQKESACMCSP